MSKRVRRGFGPREISTSHADFFSFSAGYDNKGVNPLGNQLLLLGILPVVVGHDGGSLRVAEFQEWIGQRASDAELRQRRPDR